MSRSLVLTVLLALATAFPSVARQEVTTADDRRIQAAGLLVRGLTRSFLGDEAGALVLLERAASLAPDDAALHSALATSADRLGQAPRAVAHARRAVELAPDRAEFSVALARLLGASGDAAGAVALMDRVVVDHPGMPGLALERVRLLAALEQRTAAWEGYRDLVRDGPVPDVVLEESFDVAMDLGLLDDALALVEQLAERHPGDAGFVRRRGELLVRLGREDEARAAFGNAAALDPEDREAREALDALLRGGGAEASDVASAGALVADGRAREAARALSAIVDDDPARLDAWQALLVALRAAGDPAAAADRAGDARLFFPGDPELALQAGFSALEALRPADAWSAFERVLFLEAEAGTPGSARATTAAAAGALALALTNAPSSGLPELFEAFSAALADAGRADAPPGRGTPFERMAAAGPDADALDAVANAFSATPLALVAAGDALARAGRATEARARWLAAEAAAAGNPVTRIRLAR